MFDLVIVFYKNCALTDKCRQGTVFLGIISCIIILININFFINTYNYKVQGKYDTVPPVTVQDSYWVFQATDKLKSIREMEKLTCTLSLTLSKGFSIEVRTFLLLSKNL